MPSTQLRKTRQYDKIRQHPMLPVKLLCRKEIYNVGCMYWNYEPVTLDEIIAVSYTHLGFDSE